MPSWLRGRDRPQQQQDMSVGDLALIRRGLIASYLYRALFLLRLHRISRPIPISQQSRQVAHSLAALEGDPDLWMLQKLSAYPIAASLPCNKRVISKR